MIRSPLADALRAKGATLAEFRGTELAADFGDVEAEWRRGSSAAGIFDLAFRSALCFRGDDRQTFLHNLLSNDVASLRPGQGCHAALLTQQSRVVADAFVFCRAQSVRMELDRALAERSRAHLEKYLVADDVEIEDLGATEAAIGVFGPRAAEVLAAAGAALPSERFAHLDGAIGGVPVWIARTDASGDLGYEIVTVPERAAELLDRLLAAGEPFGAGLGGMRALDVLRLEAGIPWPGIDFDDQHLVLEAGLEHAIHFQKGCYLGQEIVERASARGQVNRRLVGLRLSGTEAPARGAAITSGTVRRGEVTSAVFSFHDRAPIALGYLRREAANPGQRLEVEVPSGTAAAEIAPLPFRKRSGM